MKNTAKIISIIKYTADMVGGRYRNNYSGRCMYGRKCVGVTTDCPDGFLIELGINLKDDGIRTKIETRRDSMGVSTIIYFPTISE